MLRRLRLQLTGRADVGHQSQVHIQHIIAPDVVRHLPNGFEKREAFNVSDRSADFDDGDIRSLGDPHDRLLDLIRDMRHHLHRPAEIISPPLLGDDRMIDATRRVITFFRQRERGKSLVMSEIEIGLGAIIRDKDFAVLVGIHRPGIDIDVGIQLEKRDLQPAAFEEVSDRSRCQPLPKR